MQPRRGDVLAEASEHLERVECHALLAGDGMGPAPRVGTGAACAGDIKPLEKQGAVVEEEQPKAFGRRAWGTGRSTCSARCSAHSAARLA